MGNYHHHQNPSAYRLDLNVVSTVCNLYVADALYAIDSAHHSPLLGFAYDGFPIYGAYGYKNTDGTGGIVRIKSSFKTRNITTRTTYASGTTVTAGPSVSSTYPLGYFREDYTFDTAASAAPDYLDEHNGRFCVTPEYPSGIYAYFCTVDSNWNSAYPYCVGPTFYGVVASSKVTTVTETTTTYTAPTAVPETVKVLGNVTIFPNPAADLVAIQIQNIARNNVTCQLFDLKGSLIQSTIIYQGSTMAYFDLSTLYNGQYIIRMQNGEETMSKQITIAR
jgi:hypothetical protein